MLSASCPSCGSPLRFAHAAAPVVVCPSCQSTVVRSDLDELVVQGKVSAFGRDLSPLRVGVTGSVGSRRFEIVGVLRKGRDAVRWSEWFLVYDDGGHAWLGEGHGLFQLYEEQPVRVNMPGFDVLSPGQRIQAGNRQWRVLEVARARVLAAEGSLPFPVDQDQSWPYADLRSADGRFVGTLDGAEGDFLLYSGRAVELPALEPEGLRPMAGWSDDVLVNFEGPEVQGVRKLSCPACRAPVELRAPGQSAHVACEYCGSELGLEELAGGELSPQVLARSEQPSWIPGLKLGSKGKLGGIEYAVIGAMKRGVWYSGQLFDWTEYFLYNPYRGVAWLVRDGGGHWLLVHRMAGFPQGSDKGDRSIEWRGQAFQHFQTGDAHVLAVLGEFNWEVRTGDRAGTIDYIAPPLMLSVERTGEEIAWSLGEYLDASTVAEAFDAKLSAPTGVAPAQPNPYKTAAAWSRALLQTAVLVAGVALFWGFTTVVSAKETLATEAVRYEIGEDVVELSEVFEVPEGMRRNLRVTLDSTIGRDSAQVHVALVNKASGKVYLPVSTRSANKASGWVSMAEPGPYVARVEVAASPEAKARGVGEARATVTVVHDHPWHTPFLVGFLLALLGPLLLYAQQAAFESRRWAESDHA